MDLSDVLWSGQGSAYSFTDSSNDSYSPSNSTSTPPFYQPHSPLGNLTFPFLQESQYSPHPPHQPNPFENVMLPDIQMEANGESGSDGALPSEAVRQGGVVPQRVGSGPWRCQHCPKVIVKHSQFVIVSRPDFVLGYSRSPYSAHCSTVVRILEKSVSFGLAIDEPSPWTNSSWVT